MSTLSALYTVLTLMYLLSVSASLNHLTELKAEDTANTSLFKRMANSERCLSKIYIMAYTSGVPNAGADLHHAIEIRAKGNTQHITLPNLPGDDYYPRKGDLWKINIEDFHFPHNCIKCEDVEHITILERNNDGWNIDSIVTFLYDGEEFKLATLDMDIYHWIDGNSHQEYTRLELTNVDN